MMKTMALAFALLCSLPALASDEVVELQADLFTGSCAVGPMGNQCALPPEVGHPFHVALHPSNIPGELQGSVFLETRAEGRDFEAQVIVHKSLSNGRYGVEIFHTAIAYDYYGRPYRETRSLGYVALEKLSELNQIQFIGNTYVMPDHWMWSAVAVGPCGRALSAGPYAARP